MKPTGEWSVPKTSCVYGQVVSTSPEDSAYPGGADEETIRAYGGHLVAESISPAMRETIAAIPDMVRAIEGLLNVCCTLDVPITETTRCEFAGMGNHYCMRCGEVEAVQKAIATLAKVNAP